MDTLELSSVDTLDISFSPASFQSFRDLLDFIEPLRCTQDAPPSPAGSCSSRLRAAAILQHPSARVQCHRGLTDEAPPVEALNLFQCCNRTGLALSCYGKNAATGMKLLPTAGARPLAFSPTSSRVHLPDFGREVLHPQTSWGRLCDIVCTLSLHGGWH